MGKFISYLSVCLFFFVTSCEEKKYVPVSIKEDVHTLTSKESPQEKGFKIAYEEDGGVKKVHIKLNKTAGFNAIFDTGAATGLLISVLEANSLAKSGTLSLEDSVKSQKSSMANGFIIENDEYNIHEVTVVDTKGVEHTLYDVPAIIVDNPFAEVLVGNEVIDKLAANRAYTIDLQQKVIIFQ